MTVKTGDRAPDFDLEVTHEQRVTLADFIGRSNLLLVFHPLAFTQVCEDEALDLQENLESFRAANTEVVFVSCDTSAARQAWRAQLGAEYVFASDFWDHGAAARAYGVFDDTVGTARRGTFLIDVDGVVIWSLVNEVNELREELGRTSLTALADEPPGS
jgi:peroxiredoxin